MKIFLSGVESLISNRKSGSSELLSALIEICSGYIERNEKSGALFAIMEPIASITGRLPQFPVIGHFCNALLAYPDNARTGIKDFVTGYEVAWKEYQKDIIDDAIQRLNPAGKKLITHSNSSTVKLFFSRLKQQGLHAEITQCRSKPGEEGVIQGHFLQSLGFPVRIIDDDCVEEGIAASEIVLIGADAVCTTHIYNKVGSRKMAELAHAANKIFCVIADPRKCLDAEAEDHFRASLAGQTVEGAPLNRFEWVERNLCPFIFGEQLQGS